jgi:hypothetical protein
LGAYVITTKVSQPSIQKKDLLPIVSCKDKDYLFNKKKLHNSLVYVISNVMIKKMRRLGAYYDGASLSIEDQGHPGSQQIWPTLKAR